MVRVLALWIGPGVLALLLGLATWKVLSIGRSLFQHRLPGARRCVLALSYLWALPVYTLLPLPLPSGMTCEQRPAAQWWPGESFRYAWYLLLHEPGLHKLTNVYMLQYPLNALLFAPLGVGAVLLTTWRLRSITAGAAVISTGIEIIQATEWFGLYPCLFRTAQTDDIIVNVLGAFGAAACTQWLLGLRGQRRPVLQRREILP